MEIIIDPKNFIRPPYRTCPKCDQKSFGVLSIYDQHYVRRCKKCWHSSSYLLPPLNKKVIYIDQMALSNMMKSLNPNTKAYQKGTIDPIWRTLFEKLDTLCKLQLIICPDSDFHTSESLLSPFYPTLKRMYELLSHGVSFYHHEDIKRFQICEHAKNWLGNEEDKPPNLDINSVVHGNINAWQEPYIISVNWERDQDSLDKLRETREKVHTGFLDVFRQWQKINKSFEDTFEDECMAFGRTVLQVYCNWLGKLVKVMTGQAAVTNEIAFPPSPVNLIHSITDVFRRAGINEDEIMSKIVAYLRSPSLKNVPFLRISAMLYAALARKAAAGQKRLPSRGMITDIELISVLLPYCDAMFIDNECYGLLREVPLCNEINYGTRLFSLNTIDKFFSYLDEIKSSASDEHLTKIAEVYGKNWGQPYITLYRSNR
ncbi:MAG: hypothetical protein H0Z39_08115 [Peptococcaceae bacterium]|nr:hypothetical protein [Peptococcaceae bacterium]